MCLPQAPSGRPPEGLGKILLPEPDSPATPGPVLGAQDLNPLSYTPSSFRDEEGEKQMPCELLSPRGCRGKGAALEVESLSCGAVSPTEAAFGHEQLGAVALMKDMRKKILLDT